MAAITTNEHYHALVDMGSNGIRFSISDLSPPTARILPTIYQDRSGISLYDAQYENGRKVEIPPNVIDDVITALLRFKRTCQDFGVRDDRVRVVATEAMRNASNSQDLQQKMQTKTGWKVELLPKEDEGSVGAMGIASSFQSIKGLVLDLGGGSVQMTWMIADDGEVQTSPKGSVSFPYGAAALTMLLEEAGRTGQDDLREKLITGLAQAIKDLDIPQSLTHAAEKEGGFTLHLSGGGFRGWGYILMSLHAIQPYPIPMINGFLVPRSAFLPRHNSVPEDSSTFRISSRRASQIPAISFLIQALIQALPSISNIRFAQGGVREGLLYSQLSPAIRAHHPLVTATVPYAPRSAQALLHLLKSAIPPPTKDPNNPPATLTSSAFLTSVINLLNAHAPLPKDIRPAAALRSTTTGLLAASHGLDHADRALLALVLCARWGGELSPTDMEFFAKMQELAGARASWWARYIGRVAQGLGECFPAGVVGSECPVKMSVGWRISDMEKWRGKEVVRLDVEVWSGGIEGAVEGMRAGLEALGKKKNWVGGREGEGNRVEVHLSGISLRE